MISVAEARSRILEAFDALPPEQVAISEADGRVLAEDVRARVTKPPQDVSAMDGYAVRAEDVASVPATLRVVGEAPAGGAYGAVLGSGEAVRIFTGGPLPEGADTIVIQENTSRDSDRVTVTSGAATGRYVRRRGLDFAEGDAGPAAGTRLGPRQIGLIAAMNVPWVMVARRPRVAILGTGDEIVNPGEPLGPNQIISSNALALAAIVREAGAEPHNLGIASDDEASLRRMAQGAARADLLVVTGGMSVGDHDLVRHVLGAEGLAIDFWKIAMRPGKPLMFGKKGNKLVFGLPGNPVSALVTATVVVLPALRALNGSRTPVGPRLRLPLAVDLKPNGPRRHFIRATIAAKGDGISSVRPLPETDSAHISSFFKANALIVHQENAPGYAVGDLVDVIPLRAH